MGAKMETLFNALNAGVPFIVMILWLFMVAMVTYIIAFNKGKEVGYTAGFYRGKNSARAMKAKGE